MLAYRGAYPEEIQAGIDLHRADTTAAEAPVKILLDEIYLAAVAEALRASGIDATTVAEQRLRGAPDAKIFGAAVADRFCVLTEDRITYLKPGAG